MSLPRRTLHVLLAVSMLSVSGLAGAQLVAEMAATAAAPPALGPATAADAAAATAAANAQIAINQTVAARGLPPSPVAPGASSAGQPAVPAEGIPVVPAPPLAAPSLPSPLSSPEPAPLANDYVIPGEDMLQETARLTGLATREKAEASLEQARQQRALDNIKFQADMAAARAKVEEAENGGVKKRTADQDAEVVRHAYVSSIYRFGPHSYADMMIGRNHVVAREGTRLIDGSHVERIEEASVTVKGPHGTFVLPVRGSAGYAAPVGASPALPR